MASPLIQRIDDYLHRVPRSGATAEEVGPFTLFVGMPGGWQYYARPRPVNAAAPAEISAVDVRRVLARQRELDLPETIEAIAEAAPALATACRDAGLTVSKLPLLIHHDSVAVPVPDGIRIRRLDADDPAVAAAQVVADLAFAESGTSVGVADDGTRDAAIEAGPSHTLNAQRHRIREGLTVVVVAEDEHGVLATGSHQPVADVTEIVGVATLPSARRQGLGAAVTNTLVADAFRRGVMTVLLSAGDDDVARVYERVGFGRVGTALAGDR